MLQTAQQRTKQPRMDIARSVQEPARAHAPYRPRHGRVASRERCTDRRVFRDNERRLLGRLWTNAPTAGILRTGSSGTKLATLPARVRAPDRSEAHPLMPILDSQESHPVLIIEDEDEL